MSFLRHRQSTGPIANQKNRGAGAPLPIVRDESHRLSLGGLHSCSARFRFAGCLHRAIKKSRRSSGFNRTATCGLTGCLSPRVHFKAPSLHRHYPASSLLRASPPPSRLRSLSRFGRLYELPCSADFPAGRGRLLQLLSMSLPPCCPCDPAEVTCASVSLRRPCCLRLILIGSAFDYFVEATIGFTFVTAR
jgi:hypothetical protein